METLWIYLISYSNSDNRLVIYILFEYRVYFHYLSHIYVTKSKKGVLMDLGKKFLNSLSMKVKAEILDTANAFLRNVK